MNHNVILTSLSILIMISYLFGIISNKVRIPSVLLLIIAGILAKLLLERINLQFAISLPGMHMVGTLGLILIVLEGSLDLKIRKGKIKLITYRFLFSLIMIVLLSVTIGTVIGYFYKETILVSLVNAVPLSIISSAITIPSVSILSQNKREFLEYNSIFSDILGVLILNFLAFFDITKYAGVIGFSASLILTICISVLFSFVLVLFLGSLKQENKFIFILASIILLYSVGKLFHLSSLILVFIFGIIVNNFYGIHKKFAFEEYSIADTDKALNEFKTVIGQFSFIFRTIFFFLFGFSIEIRAICNNKVLITGGVCLALIYLFRYLMLKYLFSCSNFVQVLTTPRGLITILLFYTIPQGITIQDFDKGIILNILCVLSSYQISITNF